MAADTLSGLNATPINPTGLAPEHLQAYMDALKGSADALQARYANPNWFNVAAGFLKPQLGGFAASLGSAGAALGDWQEKQRANELPVAQMRAELGKVGMLQSQQNQADALIRAHGDKPVTGDLYQKVVSLVGEGNPMAKSLAGKQSATRADITNVAAQRALDSQRVEGAYKTGIDSMTGRRITDVGAFAEELAIKRGEPQAAALASQVTGPARTPAAGAPAAGAPAAGAPAGAPGAPALNRALDLAKPPTIGGLSPPAAGDSPGLKELRSIQSMPEGAEKTATLEQYAKDYPLSGAAPTPSTAAEKTAPTKTEYIPRSVPKIDTTGMTGPDAAAANDAYTAGVKAKQDQFGDQAKRIISSAAFDTMHEIENPARRIIATADKSPTVFAKVHDLVNQNGAFAAAIQQGFSFHLPGTGPVGVGIDLRNIINASFPPHERAVAEHLVADYMRLGIANASRSGVSANTLAAHPNTPESQAMMMTASGIQQTPDSALLGVYNTLHDLEKRKDEKKTYEKLYRKTDPHSPTRDADVLQHPEFESLYKYHAQKAVGVHNEFLDAQARRAAKLAAKEAAKAKGTP